MNPNENHVSPLTQQIDNLIENLQPTGIPAADDLATTIPQARQDFQQQLEDRLAAQIQFASQGDAKLTSRTASLSNASRPRAYLPLTLAAAMLAVVIVGSLLLLRGSNMPDSNFAVVFDALDTPTPEPTAIRMVNIVVASQDLPRGFQFPSTVAELTRIVSYAPWPESAVPFNALLEDQGGVGKLAGKILRTDVYREQPIMVNLLTNDITQIASVGSDAAIVLPADQLAISLPMKLLDGVNKDIQVGVQVDISALVAFVRARDSYSDIATQKIVRNATIVHLGDFPPATPSTATPDIITVSASRDEVETLAFLVNSEIPMTIELSNSPTTTPVPDQADPTIANQKVAVTIPADQIVAAPIGRGIQAGDHVSITAKFTFVNASDELFQAATPPASIILIPPTPGAVITLVPSNNDGGNVHIISQEVIKDAAVVDVSAQDDNVTIEVSQQEATVMKWLIDAKIPLKLQPITPTPGMSLPASLTQVEIPLDSLANFAPDIKAGDMVDVVLAFAGSSGDGIKLSFTPTGGNGYNVDSPSFSTFRFTNNDLQNGMILVRRFVSNAQVIEVKRVTEAATGREYKVAKLAVTQDEAGIIQFYILEQGLPFTIIPH